MENKLDVYKEWLGIPEGDRPPAHYELLRLVQFEDDIEKIRKNYRKLNTHVRQFATGKYSLQSQDLLNELAKAMLCLTDPERKREYDENLGRVFVEEASEFAHRPMERILVDQGHITAAQTKEAKTFADARGLSMRDAVVQMKLVNAETAQKAYAEELGYSFVDLSEMIPDDSILDQIPRKVVKHNKILPLFEDDGMLLVACIDEPSTEIEDEIRLRYKMPMRPVLVTPLALNQAFALYYAPGTRDDADSGSGSSKAKNRKPKSELSADELRERKMMGGMFIMWAIIGSVIIDYFLLPPGMLVSGWSDFFLFSFFPFLFTLIIPPAVAFWVIKFYWK